MLRFLTAVLAFCLACAALRAQNEAVEIKFGTKKAGDKYRVTTNVTRTVDVVTNAGLEDEKKKKDNSEEKYVYLETILEKPDPKKMETKATRLYETAVKTVAGKTTTLSFEKKIVLIELNNEKYTFTVDGKPLAAEEELIIAMDYAGEKYNVPDGFLPEQAVKAGEKWKIDTAKAKKQYFEPLAFVIDDEKVNAIGKLVKVYIKDSQRYGVFEFAVEIPLSKMKADPMPLPVKAGSTMVIKMQFDFCIDGSAFCGVKTGSVLLDLSSVNDGKGAVAIKTKIESYAMTEKLK